MKYSITEKNGNSFATIITPASQTVLTYISLDTHSENSAHTLAATLVYSDILLAGAGKYDRDQFLDALNMLGANISVHNNDGILTFIIRCRKEVLKKVLTLFEAIINEPRFDKKELTRIKQTLTNQLREHRENSKALAHESLRNTIYGHGDRRYTFSIETMIEAVKSITAKDLAALHKRVTGVKWTCSTASDTQSSQLLSQTVTKVRKGKAGVTVLPIHQQKPPSPHLVLKDIPSKQNIDFSIGAPVPITLQHPDYIPLVFALAVLGIGGFQSRLMSTVREKEGLTYGIYANAETFTTEEQGYWRIISFFSPEKAVQGLTSTFREVRTLYKKGITQSELEIFKTSLNTKQILLGDSTTRLLNDLHAFHKQGYSVKEIIEHKKKLLSLTVEEVNAAIKEYLNPTNLTISGAGPIKAVKKDLEAFMTTVS